MYHRKKSGNNYELTELETNLQIKISLKQVSKMSTFVLDYTATFGKN
jgi:hypothetical protein